MKKSLLLIALSFGLFGCEKDVREPQLLDGALYVVGDVNGCINGNGYGTEIRTELWIQVTLIFKRLMTYTSRSPLMMVTS